MNSTSQIMFFAGTVLAVATLQATTISNVTIRQRWPWSQKADVSYVLSEGNAEFVSLALYSEGKKLDIPVAALSGDLWNVSPGLHKITIDPQKTAYTNMVLTNVRAEVSMAEPPLYLVIDLTKKENEVGQLTYLTAYDITNSASAWGSWEPSPVKTNGVQVQDTIIWTAATNYLNVTSNLVMRYAPAGTFLMGSPETELYRDSGETQHKVTLTRPFFVGIGQVTFAQFKLVTGDPHTNQYRATYENFPANNLSWMDVRGTNSWPMSSVVSNESFMGKVRSLTGLNGFDLPTEAQWEYACRAGTLTAFNTGYDSLTNATLDLNLDAFARFGGSHAGWSFVEAGKKAPNAWGLYNMHGNVWEWCLDWSASYPSADVTDPPGEKKGSWKIYRGGGWNDPARNCRSAKRGSAAISYYDAGDGFRLFLNLR